MKPPNAGLAIVSRDKIVNYLLSPAHPRGKAGFFTRFGFTLADWQSLASALRRHVLENDVKGDWASPFGTLPSPDGRSPVVRSVWMIETGEAVPRLITAYPLQGEP